jgi:hypothetical protein
MSRVLRFTGLAAIILLSAVSLQPAAARILCHGQFQVTQYGLIATPYCGDEEIARVAHSYGWHREAATVHTNPLSKVYICQTLGYDWRIQSPCGGYLIHGGGRKPSQDASKGTRRREGLRHVLG